MLKNLKGGAANGPENPAVQQEDGVSKKAKTEAKQTAKKKAHKKHKKHKKSTQKA